MANVFSDDDGVQLIPATCDSDWTLASDFLLETVERCRRQQIPLWTHEQVCVAALKQNYHSQSLHLLRYRDVWVGCVFISFDSDVFWPDIDTNSSVFFHKLAISDAYHGQGLGQKALAALGNLAKHSQRRWLRCDCHGARPRLRAFYQAFGFDLVDRKPRLGFDVARYQMRIESAHTGN